MRILVVNPYGRHGYYSGPAILMERLFSTVALTNEVVVLGGRDAAPPGGYPWARRTVGLSANDSLGGFQQSMWSLRAFVWLLTRGRTFDLVHFHGGYLSNLVPALAARLCGVPYAVIALAANGDLSVNSRLAQIPPLDALRRYIVSHAAVGYALADDIRMEFECLGLNPDRIHALGNAVDVHKYQPSLDLKDDRRINSRTLIFVGKVGRRKRATMVLEAVALLHRHGQTARAVFVGPFDDDQFELEFRRLSKELGLGASVTITGHVADVHSYLLSDVSIFVLPSAQEGLPGALVEAMAAGLPCVVTNVGSMGEVVRDARAGEVIEPTASAIAAFAAKAWADADLWRAWSSAGRDYAIRHYSTQRVAAQYLEALEGLGRRAGKMAFDDR
jgi:glycosyltransferase involved in cell wall biosynthesis